MVNGGINKNGKYSYLVVGKEFSNEMSESGYKPLRQVPETIKFNQTIKAMKVVFWILQTLAFLGFGVLLQGKYIPYASGSVRNIVHWIVLFASFLLFLLGFLCNFLIARWLNFQTLVGGMIAGLKVNQLLFLAKNEFNSKKEMRRRLAIKVLPLISSQEVAGVLAELEGKETGRMKEACQIAHAQVRENLVNKTNLLAERTPYKDHKGEFITTFPFKASFLLGPLIRLLSSICFLGLIIIIRGVLTIVFVDLAAKMPSVETLVSIGVGLFCTFVFPFIIFLMFHLDLRKVAKMFEEQDIQKLVDTAASGLGHHANSNLASFAFLALAELGGEGTIEPLKPVLETQNSNVQLTAVFSLDLLAVKTNYPERFSYRILI